MTIKDRASVEAEVGLNNNAVRVLHSFPHRLGRDRICTTAWYEIDSVHRAGAKMTVYAGDSVRPFRAEVEVRKTLTFGRFKLPYRVFGARFMCNLHDLLVAKSLRKWKGKIDIVHAWPLGALHTIRAAKDLGIPVALERCNAHTRFAYQVVREECERISVPLPKNHEHAWNETILNREELEYAECDSLLCPSEFVVRTFEKHGFNRTKLDKFIYGVDESLYYPAENVPLSNGGLRMIYVGVCAVRKGLHLALDAWLQSDACRNGTFTVVGGFVPAYEERLKEQLQHPSVRVLGHRTDVPELMRGSDVFILPSIEEGFGLVVTEAMASGCVPLISDACTDIPVHDRTGMIHNVGDVAQITTQINKLNSDRNKLFAMRKRCIDETPNMTWKSAGMSLIKAYRNIIRRCASTAKI